MALFPLPAPVLLAMIVTPDQTMARGLKFAGFDEGRVGRVGQALNERRFRSWYGSNPNVIARIWEDLLTTEIAEARIPPEADFDRFLMSFYFLKVYPTEEHRSGIFEVCEKTARRWSWYFVGKLSALKAQKVRKLSKCGASIVYQIANSFKTDCLA
jgi:hypothetical protein